MKNSRVCGKIIKSVKSTKKSLHLNRWDSWSCHLINGWCWHLFGLNIDVHIFILGPVLKSQRWAGVREEGACAYTGEEISGSGLSEWYGWIYVEGYTHTHTHSLSNVYGIYLIIRGLAAPQWQSGRSQFNKDGAAAQAGRARILRGQHQGEPIWMFCNLWTLE